MIASITVFNESKWGPMRPPPFWPFGFLINTMNCNQLRLNWAIIFTFCARSLLNITRREINETTALCLRFGIRNGIHQFFSICTEFSCIFWVLCSQFFMYSRGGRLWPLYSHMFCTQYVPKTIWSNFFFFLPLSTIFVPSPKVRVDCKVFWAPKSFKMLQTDYVTSVWHHNLRVVTWHDIMTSWAYESSAEEIFQILL